MRLLTIVSESKKGRAFHGVLLAYSASKDREYKAPTRPYMLQVAVSDQEAKPFLENLRMGNRALMSGDCQETTFELMKSAGYAFKSYRVPGAPTPGVVLTAYQPALFAYDPGIIDPESVQFIVMPPRERVELEASRAPDCSSVVDRFFAEMFSGWSDYKQRRAMDKSARPVDHFLSAEEQRHLTPMAMLFCGALNRRIGKPILSDVGFQVQFYLRMLRDGLAKWSHEYHGKFGRQVGYYEWQVTGGPMAPGVVCSCSQDRVGDVLAEEVMRYGK